MLLPAHTAPLCPPPTPGGQQYGGAVCVCGAGAPPITASTYKGATGHHTDSVYTSAADGSTATFACPSTSTGAPVKITDEEDLEAGQLPPAKEIVHCTPKPVPPTPKQPTPSPMKPTPVPPSPTTYKCQSNQCVAAPGGVSKALCGANCGSDEYKCVNGQCVKQAGGVSKATCNSFCV
jgi:hypothetical protein